MIMRTETELDQVTSIYWLSDGLQVASPDLELMVAGLSDEE